MPRVTIDVPKLCRLWHDKTLSRREIAIALGVSQSYLSKVAAKVGLPRRETVHSAAIDPTPEEIRARARECRERHFAERRGESERATRKRRWRHRHLTSAS